MTLDWTVLVFAAVIGACVGSFLNVCIYRLPRRESLVSPASRCPSCQTGLRWFHNIPVLGWLVLGGRCGFCRARISPQYPVIEVVTATVWVLIVWLTPPGWLLVSRLALANALIVLFMIDLEHQILPNTITIPGIVVGLALSLVAPPGLVDAVLGALLGGGTLYGIAALYLWLRGQEGMGMGDVKMLAMIGAFLGWRAVMVTLVLSSFAGALIGSAVLLKQRGNLRYALPFGTFLSIGAGIAMLAGDRLLNWYLGFFPEL